MDVRERNNARGCSSSDRDRIVYAGDRGLGLPVDSAIVLMGKMGVYHNELGAAVTLVIVSL
jgi:hypothetical protein